MTSQVKLDTPLLRAVIGRIIPPDQHPGALDLGADHYVVAQLSADPGLAAAVSRGLDDVHALATARCGRGFADLLTSQQDELLTLGQKADWFVALAELTAEGFYANPANGGNRDAMSWRMIGYQQRLPEGPDGPRRDVINGL